MRDVRVEQYTLTEYENKVSLKDFKGKKNVVVYFYPKALTPGCTTQACAIRDAKKKFDSLSLDPQISRLPELSLLYFM